MAGQELSLKEILVLTASDGCKPSSQVEQDYATRIPTCREQFEAWISAPPFEKSVSRNVDDPSVSAWPGSYRWIDVELAWQAWLEAWDRGNRCLDGCKIKRAVKEMADSLDND